MCRQYIVHTENANTHDSCCCPSMQLCVHSSQCRTNSLKKDSVALDCAFRAGLHAFSLLSAAKIASIFSAISTISYSVQQKYDFMQYLDNFQHCLLHLVVLLEYLQCKRIYTEEYDYCFELTSIVYKYSSSQWFAHQIKFPLLFFIWNYSLCLNIFIWLVVQSRTTLKEKLIK